MADMPDTGPEDIAEPIEEVLVKHLTPDLLPSYMAERERHREEVKRIEQARKNTRRFLKRLYGPVLEKKTAELEAEHLERVQQEDDRHAAWMAELSATIRNHARGDQDEGGVQQ